MPNNSNASDQISGWAECDCATLLNGNPSKILTFLLVSHCWMRTMHRMTNKCSIISRLSSFSLRHRCKWNNMHAKMIHSCKYYREHLTPWVLSRCTKCHVRIDCISFGDCHLLHRCPAATMTFDRKPMQIWAPHLFGALAKISPKNCGNHFTLFSALLRCR